MPGDLVVWRGHVGIAMRMPSSSTFYSSSGRGLRTEYYERTYWAEREGSPAVSTDTFCEAPAGLTATNVSGPANNAKSKRRPYVPPVRERNRRCAISRDKLAGKRRVGPQQTPSLPSPLNRPLYFPPVSWS